MIPLPISKSKPNRDPFLASPNRHLRKFDSFFFFLSPFLVTLWCDTLCWLGWLVLSLQALFGSCGEGAFFPALVDSGIPSSTFPAPPVGVGIWRCHGLLCKRAAFLGFLGAFLRAVLVGVGFSRMDCYSMCSCIHLLVICILDCRRLE